MQRRRILVVEDDSAIRRGVVDALTFAGYEALSAANGTDGQRLGTTATVDLVLLDLVLPGPGGFEILTAIRTLRPTLPVILLTARGEENDRVKGLRLGADDYVVKPFSVRELLARVEAVLRRSPERPIESSEFRWGGGVADFARRELRFPDGTREEISEKEVELLQYLAANATRVIAREELLQRIWRLDPRHTETRTIDMHIANLRFKLRDNAGEPKVLLTVRGKGYMLGSTSTPSTTSTTSTASAKPARTKSGNPTP